MLLRRIHRDTTLLLCAFILLSPGAPAAAPVRTSSDAWTIRFGILNLAMQVLATVGQKVGPVGPRGEDLLGAKRTLVFDLLGERSLGKTHRVPEKIGKPGDSGTTPMMIRVRGKAGDPGDSPLTVLY